MKHLVDIIEIEPLAMNVKRFRVQRPAGYFFSSGQSTRISLLEDEAEELERPYSITSVNTDDWLEFIIKIYAKRNGLSEKLGRLKEGESLFVSEVFGTLTYNGPGLFIAAGAGITPFISIFRQLRLEYKLDGNFLLYANKTKKDIILPDELRANFGDNYADILSRPPKPYEGMHIGKALLKKYTGAKQRHFYICGPDQFTRDINEHLLALGVDRSRIVYEHAVQLSVIRDSLSRRIPEFHL
jgi:ferredoxin-NADP reductase